MKKRLRSTPIVMFMVGDIGRLEHDAKSQYAFNRFWAALWFITMIAIPFFPSLYGHAISALIIQEISLWANFATHFGSMSSALAAMNTTREITTVDTAATSEPDSI